MLQLINSRLANIKVAYDGGEFTPDSEPDDEPDDEPNDDNSGNFNGDFNFDIDHESLTGLLGGNSDGHYHLTGEELIRLAEYPNFSQIKHENLPDLQGGDSEGHYHLDNDELKKLHVLIDTFFPDGSEVVIIKPVAPDNSPSGDSGGGSGNGSGDNSGEGSGGINYGLPSGKAPDWQINLLPHGMQACTNSAKMYYGSFPDSKGITHMF